MDTKTCIDCKSVLLLDCFPIKKRKGGKFTISSCCRACFNKKRRETRYIPRLSTEELNKRRSARKLATEKHRIKVREEFLEGKRQPCMDCKGVFPPFCMDYDHRNPNEKYKEVGILVVGRYAKSLILQEMAKCDLVCANCHRIRTAKQQNWHGQF